MMKKLLSGILLATILAGALAGPVLAQYFAYLTVEESDGNAYTNLAVTCSRNVSQMVAYDLITTSGLDTRVLTGDGEALPHMLAEDRIMFVTNLEADEDRTLIFYTGAAAQADFPIIPGYDGYITTLDDSQLELTYVMELLVSGYFDSSAGADKNILYKDEAYRVWINGANTLEVSGLESGGSEEWDMSYGSFTSGVHTIYVVSNGLGAWLYVDDFDVAKDTQNLFETTNVVLGTNVGHQPYSSRRQGVYAEGKYWVFYSKNDVSVYYKTSADGTSWSGEYSIATPDVSLAGVSVALRGEYLHIAYADDVSDDIMYRRGDLQPDSSIVWSAVWQTVANTGSTNAVDTRVAADTDQYPHVAYSKQTIHPYVTTYLTQSSNNDGTWATVGGYPLTLVNGINGAFNAALTEFPSSDEMYILYPGSSRLYGKYYNGSSWSSAETIVTGYMPWDFQCVADDDGNVYMVWSDGAGTGYFKIRYSGGTWSSNIEISDDLPSVTLYDSFTGLSVSYNTVSGDVYITYIRDTSPESVRCVTYNQNEITGEYLLFTPDDVFTATASAYGDHIGIFYSDYSPGQRGHGYLQFPWTWNDNANNWTWMQNNVMPYCDYMIMAIDGVTHLQYQPATIIQGTTLPDISGATGNHGVITWGGNPAGVNATLSVLQSDSDDPPPAVVPPGEAGHQDVVGPTGQPGWTGTLPTLPTNPLYPLVSIVSSVTNIPIGLWWIIGATFLLLLAMVITVKKVPHLIMTALVGGSLSAFFYAMGIYPFWVIFIFAVMAIAIIVGERTPAV